MRAWQPAEEPDEAMAGGPGWTEVEAERCLAVDDIDLEPGPDDETLERQEFEPTEDERWAEVGAGLVSVLDALGDVVTRLDKLDRHLDGIAGRLSDLEAAVEAEANQPQGIVSAHVVTREQAEEIAAAVLARLHQAKQGQ